SRHHRSPVRVIHRVGSPFANGYFPEVERAHAFNACDIHTILIGAGTTLVEGIDPAFRAEVMFRHLSLELVERKSVLPLQHFEVGKIYRNCNGAPHAAVRTIASTGAPYSIRQFQLETDRPAVAGCLVDRTVIGTLFSHDGCL